MLQQLIIGSTIIGLTVVIQVLFIGTVTEILSRLGTWLSEPPYTRKTIVVLICTVLWLIAGISVCAWIWAGIFILFDVFQELEPAVYFSVVTMTTLGYGDIILDTKWRLLSGLTAVNGLIIFGLTTAFLVEFIFQLRKAQTKNS